MKILQIILSAIMLFRIGGILKAPNDTYKSNGLTDMLLFPSMLVAVPMIRETGSFISLFLIITCLIYIEIDILKQKRLKRIQKFLFSIPNILGVITFMVFFINYE